MTLTVGEGPFGHRPAGRFNFEPPEDVRYVEPSPRWMRARLNGETVADSKRTQLLHEHGTLPHLLFPREDLRLDLIPPDAVSEHGVDGYVELDWHAMDEWLEEDEVAFGHPRDPFHRIDVRVTSRHVKVSMGGQTLAESTRAIALFETSLPTRWYFPPEDVRMDLLENGDKRTTCAYKGHARNFSFGEEDDIAWTYDEAEREVEPVAGRIAFYNERIDLELDGELQERPITPFSR